MATTPTVLQDTVEGFIDLRQGMSSWRHPALLPDVSVSRAINVTFRGGLAATRPGFVKLSDAPAAGGVFKGAGVWSLNSGDYLCQVVGDVLYITRADTGVSVSFPYVTTESMVHFVQADRYVVLQDGVQAPVAYEEVDGVPALYTGAVSIPVGTVSAFAHGRLHVVPSYVPYTDPPVNGQASIVSGDITIPDDPPTALLFTENDYLAEGGANGLPSELGFVGGLGTLRNAATGTGLGQTIVLARNGACAFDFSIPRSQWKNQPLSQVAFANVGGCESPRSVINANNDLLYRSHDGIRLYGYTSAQESGQTGLANTPLSFDVDTWMRESREALKLVSAAFANHRAYFTTQYADGAFRGVIVWDTAAGFYNGAQGLGAYDGMWTGLDFAQVVSARVESDRVPFLFTTSGAIYYPSDDSHTDGGTEIESKLITRTYGFGDMVTMKELRYVEMWVSDLHGAVDIDVYFRPHSSAYWYPLGSRAVPEPSHVPGRRDRVRISFDKHGQLCDPDTRSTPSVSPMFQFAIVWKGHMKLEKFRAAVQVRGEAPPDSCHAETEPLAASGYVTDETSDFTYRVEAD